MNLSGVVLELLLPGSIVVASLFAIVHEWTVTARIPDSNLFVVFAFLTVSYICGVISRHTFVIAKPRRHYLSRLIEYWPNATRLLIERIGRTIGYDAMDNAEDGKTPRFPVRDQPLTETHASELINFLRDSALASGASALWEHINYQWNAARIARNCHLPLILLAISMTTCSLHAFWYGQTQRGVWMAVAAAAAVLAAWRLTFVFKQRLYWHVDVLVRFGLLSLTGRHTTD